jgi:hypothetical protein
MESRVLLAAFSLFAGAEPAPDCGSPLNRVVRRSRETSLQFLTVNQWSLEGRTMHRNAEIIRRAHEAFNTADMKTLTELFDENAALHTPGRDRASRWPEQRRPTSRSSRPPHAAP